MYKSEAYHNAVAEGGVFSFSGTINGIAVTDDDLMEGGLEINEGLTEDGSLTIGGIITSQLSLTLNNFEGKFDALTLDESVRISGALSLGSFSVALPEYHLVDCTVTEHVATITALDLTDTLNTLLDIAHPLSGATWRDVIGAIATRFGLTVTYSAAAAAKVDGSAAVLTLLNYSTDTYKSALLYIMQRLNLFARINSGRELYIYWFDTDATPIPITDDMIERIEIEGPHTPTQVAIKPYTADEYVAAGVAGYNVMLEGCPFYQYVTEDELARRLAEFKRVTFYNLRVSAIGDPAVQIGDYIVLDNSARCPVLDKSYGIGSYMSLGFRFDPDSVASFSYAGNTELISTIDGTIEGASPYIYDHTYTESGGVYTFIAALYRGQEDITAQVDPDRFVWILRTEEGDEFYARGVTMTVAEDLAGFRGSVIGGFIDGAFEAFLVDNDTDYIVTSDGARVVTETVLEV